MEDELKRESDQNESGLPGGGKGRKDEVGRSGVYPASGPYPEGNAEIRGQMEWGQGERGTTGYEEHGSSELSYSGDQLTGGYSAEDRKTQALHVQIPVGNATLEGELNVPEGLRGTVLFAHGSGSSRHSPRNQYVARVLQDTGMATLLFDLLTTQEESIDKKTGKLRFNINFLAERLRRATEWLSRMPEIKDARIGYFGASTGAAAALVAAAEIPNVVSAIVSRGGRPDLAGPVLEKVQAPTLCIVGGEDHTVLAMNQSALMQMLCEKWLEVVPGATHLFEEPGSLERVAQLGRQWFEGHLGRKAKRSEAA